MFILPKRNGHPKASRSTERKRSGFWKESVVEISAKDCPVISVGKKNTDESELNRFRGSSFEKSQCDLVNAGHSLLSGTWHQGD